MIASKPVIVTFSSIFALTWIISLVAFSLIKAYLKVRPNKTMYKQSFLNLFVSVQTNRNANIVGQGTETVHQCHSWNISNHFCYQYCQVQCLSWIQLGISNHNLLPLLSNAFVSGVSECNFDKVHFHLSWNIP